MIEEFQTLLWVVLAGMAVGLIFDFYRMLRKYRGWGKVLTFIGDIVFSFLALLILIIFLLKANSLAFRIYIFWGSLMGLGFYLWMFSSTVTRVYLNSFRLISWTCSLIIAVLKIPIIVVEWLMRPPYALLRWLSLLLYRLFEASLCPILANFRLRILKIINQWKSPIPPERPE